MTSPPSPSAAGRQATKLPEPIDDKIIVLVDDVLYTDDTVRAALDALIDFDARAR